MISSWWFVCLVITTVIHGNKGILINICEGEEETISCTGSETISITSADYGRTSDTICVQQSRSWNTSCSTPYAKSIVEGLCMARRQCTLFANNDNFGDPCTGTRKYLSVEYSCDNSQAHSIPTPSAIWPLNTNNDVKDRSGNGNHGSSVTALTSIIGPDGNMGSGYEFSDTIHFNLPSNSALSISGSFTVTAYIKPPSTQVTNACRVLRWSRSEKPNSPVVNVKTLSLQLSLTFGGIEKDTGTLNFNLFAIENQWSFVAWSYNSNTGDAIACLNAECATQVTHTNIPVSGADVLELGKADSGFSCVVMYKEALNETQIQLYKDDFCFRGGGIPTTSTTTTTQKNEPCLLSAPTASGGGPQASPEQYKKMRSITLEGKPLVDCTDVKETAFLWTSQRNGQDEVDLTSLASRTSPILTIPPKFFHYGVYKFLFKVSVTTLGDLVSHAEVALWIEVLPSDLKAEIAGGGGRAIGWSAAFVLDGSGSMDPDAENSEGLTFVWKCTELTSQNFEALDFNSDCPVPLTSSVTTTVPRESLTAGKTYVFRLDVSKAGRATVHSYQRITIVLGDPLQIFMECSQNCENSLNPLSRLVLKATCLTCEGLQGFDYEWSMLPGQGSVIEDMDWDRDTLTGREKSNLVVKAGVFSGQQSEVYSFKCTATHRESLANGFALHTVTINTAPSPGTCTVSPASGFTLQTKFSISCTGFSDPDEPLFYEFSIRSVKTGTSTISDQMIYHSLDGSMAPQYLPLGNPKNSYALEIVVLVKDAFGAGVESTLSVIVEKATTAPDLQNFASEIHQLMVTGNSQTAMQLAAVVGSVLNAESEEDFDDNIDDKEKTDARKALRETLIGSLTGVEVDSIDSLKQTASALSIVTNSTSELSAASKANAANTLIRLSSFLSSKAADSSADGIEDSSRLLVNGLSNVIEAVIATDVKNVTSPESEKEVKQQNRNVSLVALTALKDVKKALSTNKVVGERPTYIKTDTLAMALDRRDSKDIFGRTFSSTESGDTSVSSVRMPASLPIGDSAVPMNIEMVEFHVNPFNWADNSRDIKSSITELSMMRGIEEIRLENLAEPINIYLPQTPVSSNPVALNVSTTMMAYTEFEIPQNQTTMFVNLTLFSTNSNKIANPEEAGVNVYVRYGQKPNPFQYNFKLGNYTRYGSEYVAYIPASLLLERGTYHLGVLLRNKTNTTAYDLMLSSSRSQCRYWDTAVETWRGQGCSVGPDTIPSLTHCLCTHLTSFGSTWFVMPNKLNLAEDISKFLTFWENPLTIALVVVLTIIYFLMLVWARRKDKTDQEMIGVFELSDNDPLARHAYLVTVFNGSRRQAGTTSNVTMTLFGLKGKSEPHLLQHANHRMCQTGSVDTVLLRTEEDLGDLTSIRLWHDNSGTSPDWFVSHVTVEEMETDNEWVFLCYSWLSVNIGDGVLDKVFSVATGEDLRQFNHLFTSSMSRGLKDSHLYFSIFVRPPTSEFTRVQRLSCCFCLLLCTLLTNIMFFGVEANPEAQGIPDLDFGTFVFNWHSFIISIESALIVLPINILLVEMFRRLRLRQSKNHRLDEKEEEVGHLEAIKAQVQDHKTRLYDYFKDLTKSGECEPEVFLDDLNKIIGDELEVDDQSELLLYTADDLADPDAGGSASLGGDSFNSMRVLRSEDFMSIGGVSGADVQPSRQQIDEVRQKAESESASQVGDIKSQDWPSEPREYLKTPRLLPSNLNENSNAWLKKAAYLANMKPLTYKRTEAISFNRQKIKAKSRSSNQQQTEARLTSFDRQQTEARLTSFDRQQTEARLTSFDRQQTEARLTSFYRQQTEARSVHSDKQLTEAPPISSEDENEAFHELADKLSKCRQVLSSYLSTEPAYQTKDVADLLEGTFEHFVNLDHGEGEINEEENVYKAGRTGKNPLHGVSDYLLHVQEAKHIVKEKAIILELDDTDDVTGLARIQRCCRWDGMLPWWFVYIAWILLFLVAVSAAFFTMLYGLNYGKEKSWNWLLTVLETMFMDILCLQPLKILVLALFFAVVLKRGRDEVLVRARQLTDWKWKPLKSLESNWLFYHRQHLQEMRHSDPKYRPPPEADVLKARQHHHQQKRMMAILKEIVGYVTYIWVILLIAYAQRDPQSYYLGDFVGKTVFGSSFTGIKDFPSAWEWLNTTMVDSLYPNTRPGFLMGESLYIVGQPQLRQVRALTSSCSSFGDIVVGVCRRDAVGGYTEDTSAYNLTWSCPVDRSPAVISKCSRLQTAYIYQTGDTLRSLPLLGQVFSFSGGGYIVRLGSTGNDARQVLRDLHRQLWLDKNSIAILLEFTVYSANTNLFLVVTGVLEFPDAGSAVVSSIRQPIRLYRYTTPVHVVVLACEIFYCAFMIAFIVAAILNIRREKWRYFHSYWNWLQVTIILVSIATIVVYILRSVETTRLLHQYKNDQTQFLSFAHAAFLDSILGYLIAFLVVLGTLKFLHLLRFNPQIFYFLQTLNASLATLKFHLLSLLILWFAYSGFGAMMFGRHVREYSSLAQALMNLFNLAYGRIDEQYRDLAVVDVNTARFFLFSFVIVSNYLIFNIMISSILYFYDAVMTKGAPNEDTELLLLMLQRIGEFLGLKFFKAKDDKKAKK